MCSSRPDVQPVLLMANACWSAGRGSVLPWAKSDTPERDPEPGLSGTGSDAYRGLFRTDFVARTAPADIHSTHWVLAQQAAARCPAPLAGSRTPAGAASGINCRRVGWGATARRSVEAPWSTSGRRSAATNVSQDVPTCPEMSCRPGRRCANASATSAASSACGA